MNSIVDISKTALVALASTLIFFTSCKKDNDTLPLEQEKKALGVYVLSEGPFSEETFSSNSVIAYYDLQKKEMIADYYKSVNGTDLGVNANDLKVYGSKLYCVLTGTEQAGDSYVIVMDVHTGKSLKKIPFFEGENSFLPRSIAFYQNKAYVSNYNGEVLRVDTASLTVDGSVTLSKGLEQLSVANHKLYVANSNHFLHAGKANVVSVINLSSFTKLKDIEVDTNPFAVTSTANGDILVSSIGTYDNNFNYNNDASVSRINTTSDTKEATYQYNGDIISDIITADERAYVYGSNFIKTYNADNGILGNNFISDGTTVVTPYGMAIESLSNDVYVADANNYSPEGKLICFDKDGKKKFEETTASIPKSIAFRYNK